MKGMMPEYGCGGTKAAATTIDANKRTPWKHPGLSDDKGRGNA
jgi:hypothetical protein